MAKNNYLPKKKDLQTLVCHWEDADAAKAFPAIYQLLSQAKVDGRYRAGARLTLFCEDGRLKASIWDPDTSQVWFCTLETIQGAVEAIEAILSRGGGEWREKRDPGTRK